MKELTAFKRVLTRRGRIKETDITYEIQNGTNRLRVIVTYDYEPKKAGWSAFVSVYRAAVKAAKAIQG